MTVISLWELMALAGLAIAAWEVRETWKDSRALSESGRNGLLRVVADGNMHRAWDRFAKFALTAAMGLLAYVDVLNGRMFYAALIGLHLLIVMGAVADARMRRRLQEYDGGTNES